MILDTEKVLREADGPVESGSSVRAKSPNIKRHKSTPVPQALNYRVQRQQWKNNGTNWRTYRHGS